MPERSHALGKSATVKCSKAVLGDSELWVIRLYWFVSTNETPKARPLTAHVRRIIAGLLNERTRRQIKREAAHT